MEGPEHYHQPRSELLGPFALIKFDVFPHCVIGNFGKLFLHDLIWLDEFNGTQFASLILFRNDLTSNFRSDQD